MAEEATVVNNTEAVDTSNTDSTTDVNETSDAGFAGFDEGYEDTTSDDDAPIVADEEESTEEESTDSEEPEDNTAPETEESPDETESEEPQTPAEKRKEQLNSEIRDLVSQRNQLRQQVEQMNREAYPVATEEQLQDQINPETGEYYTSVEAKLARMEQQQQLRDYTERVAESQLTVSHEAQRALSDFPMFDSQSPDYNPEIAAQADRILQANLVQDPNTGQIIGSRVSPYELYKSFADVWQRSNAAGAAKGQKAVEKMLSNADAPSNRTVPTQKKDPFLEAFDSDEY